MNRFTRNRPRYIISALAAAVTAVGGLLVSSPAASANVCGTSGCTPSFELAINGGFQEYARTIEGPTFQPNSVTVQRGSNHSQRIDLQVRAGCRLRANVLNIVTLDYRGDVVKSYNFYAACVVKTETAPGGGDETDTFTFDHMTITDQPATS
ncbi:hypothetical protein [Kitasatospora sp. NPDC017646]|uniref:hypothetical protein n=1 Tax=Kitasatospora sp. NPDC017646 TaxID=3364024 RepID=UPI00378DAE85